MGTFLFDSIIFGPVWSRRLGESLGINILPATKKICNFNCLYCECGRSLSGFSDAKFPTPIQVKNELEKSLQVMHGNNTYLDSITFAGNGEPTLHPDFDQILEDTILLRNRYYPKARVAVLSNATRIGNNQIFQALQKADMNILKLDSAIETTLRRINCPEPGFSLSEILHYMKNFRGKLLIQTLFFKGKYQGFFINNASPKEVAAWLHALDQLKPECVMIYSIARDTAVGGLTCIELPQLNAIASQVKSLGICTLVTP